MQRYRISDSTRWRQRSPRLPAGLSHNRTTLLLPVAVSRIRLPPPPLCGTPRRRELVHRSHVGVLSCLISLPNPPFCNKISPFCLVARSRHAAAYPTTRECGGVFYESNNHTKLYENHKSSQLTCFYLAVCKCVQQATRDRRTLDRTRKLWAASAVLLSQLEGC